MVDWTLKYTKQAVKDSKKIKQSAFLKQTTKLIEILRKDPYQKPPPVEKLIGDLKGAYSRRINIQHRLVYQPYDEEKIVKIIRMWSHYE